MNKFFLSLIFLFSIKSCQASSIFEALKFFHIVKQRQHMIIERFGKFNKIFEPGINFKIPILDVAREIDWNTQEVNHKGNIVTYTLQTNRIDGRETMVRCPEEQIITKDNARMGISAIIYYKIVEPKLAVYGIDDLPKAVLGVAQTTLRNEIGAISLDETLISRDRINTNLRSILARETEKWGVEVTRVELQAVNPPPTITQAMENEMSAERQRRADVIEAEGRKKAAILKAEGERQAAINRAEGHARALVLSAESEAEAMRKKAQAQQEALAMISKEISNGDSVSFVLAQEYIKTMPEVAKNAGSIVVPYDNTSLVSISKILQGILKEKK